MSSIGRKYILVVVLICLVQIFCQTKRQNNTRKYKPLRWGIVSSGHIAADFVQALAVLPTTDHAVLAVASHKRADVETFAIHFNIPRVYENYEDLAADNDIDIAYLATNNTSHLANAKLMLQHKKHVLCEKPLAMNQKQTELMVELANKYGVFLMEAIWSRATPIYYHLRKALRHKTIGNITHCDAILELDANAARGSGALLDIGIYSLQFVQLVFHSQEPTKIKYYGMLNENGADIRIKANITSQDWTAFVSFDLKAIKRNIIARVIGSEGVIEIPQFICPTVMFIKFNNGSFLEINEMLPESDRYFFHRSVGLSYEAEEVRQCLLQGRQQSPLIPWSDTIQLSRWMGNIRKRNEFLYNSNFQ